MDQHKVERKGEIIALIMFCKNSQYFVEQPFLKLLL